MLNVLEDIPNFVLIQLFNPFRFFRFMFLLFAVHQMALGLFRMMAAVARDMVIANTFGSAALLIIFLLGGFILPKSKLNMTDQFVYAINWSQSF